MHSKKYGTSGSSSLSGFRVPRDVTSRAILDFLQSIDNPRSLMVALLYKSGEYRQITELSIDPLNYNSSVDFRDSYAATQLLSKFQDFPGVNDKREKAVTKFLAKELNCRETNKRLLTFRSQNYQHSDLATVLSRMSFKIGKLLGDVSGQEIFDNCDWGPGASTLVPSRVASKPHKFQFETGITRRLYDLLCPGSSMAILGGYSPLWSRRLQESAFPFFQRGNKVVTVPKNSDIDRVIAIEPGLNIWFQKGIGSVLRRKLRKWGVDLDDQSLNQESSRVASRDGHLATVDFSSASDTISYQLVRELLPDSWFELMCCARSDSGSLDGTQITWEKFSSMGNGFTFELESLIFHALATVCAEDTRCSVQDVKVYGDDVIIPVQALDAFAYYSECLGFSFNSRKTHSASPFRESCGAHWYGGNDVKPIFLKKNIDSIQAVFRFANSVRRLSHRMGVNSFCDDRFRSLFYRLTHVVPKRYCFWIPDGFGDGGFIGNLDETVPRRASYNFKTLYHEGFVVKHVVNRSITTDVSYVGLLLDQLSRLEGSKKMRPVRKGNKPFLIESEPSVRWTQNSVSTRDHTKPVISTGIAPEWYNLGPWM